MRYLIHHGMEDSATRYPDKDAVRLSGEGITYAELSQRSSQLAHFLIERGVSRRDRVGVFMDKRLETVISIYGIMKAGGVYVPLDPRSPASRLVTIIRDCDLKGIITQQNKAAIIADVAAQQDILQFVVGTSAEGVDCYSWDDVNTFPASGVPSRGTTDADLAYIMYTSGSTGAPKGIMHTHYSGLSYVKMSAALYDVTHDDRLSNHSPLHFDMSTFDYLTSLNCGATTVIIPEAFTLFPVNLAQLIEDERLTIWYSVPFALIQLLLRANIAERDLSSLRWILYGGEPFAINHLRDLMHHLPNARISNVYGPAEVNQCTYYNLPPLADMPDVMESVPIGVAVPNDETLVLDDNDAPVVPGEVGELLVQTPTMMQGYWNRPEMNVRVFYHREIYPDYVQTYLRTGDLVYENADGLLEFMGRKDHQVKVRGYRVELAEVDRVLGSHDAVEEAASYITRINESDEIAAAVRLRDGAAATANDIITLLRENVPHYAVPRQVHFVTEFPRTGTGKIDRKRLDEAVKAL
ncbi:MAG: amino acid adenylation domain-containing protein [Chloroflexota bacterium]